MTERTRQSGGIPQPVTDGCATEPCEIRLLQLLAAKHAIGLEAKGLRHSRFRCGVRGLWAKHYGMPPRSKPLAVIARIQEEIDSLSADPQQELPL